VIAIRRIGPRDEGVLALLAADEDAFDLEEQGGPRAPVTGVAAADYLADQHVLHWIAEDGAEVVGQLLCYVERRRAADPLQLLLYEIGVRDGCRRQGIGTALLRAMDEWMDAAGVREVWLLAHNPEAVRFYAACGFVGDDEQPTSMTRRAPV
jgi:ribosomal protein S18 acetylase RimI-like enzyme